MLQRWRGEMGMCLPGREGSSLWCIFLQVRRKNGARVKSSSFSVVTWRHVDNPPCNSATMPGMSSCPVRAPTHAILACLGFTSKNFISSETHKTLTWCIPKAFRFQSWKTKSYRIRSCNWIGTFDLLMLLSCTNERILALEMRRICLLLSVNMAFGLCSRRTAIELNQIKTANYKV